jgi:hypothetical protein
MALELTIGDLVECRAQAFCGERQHVLSLDVGGRAAVPLGFDGGEAATDRKRSP